MTTAELHTLTGAYAVHALSGPEQEEFERHLADCPSCSQEVRELTATAERLALAAAVVPPPHFKEQVMRRIDGVRQEPPTIARQGRRALTERAGGVRRVQRYALAACMAGVIALGGVAVWQHQAADDARRSAARTEQRANELSRVLAAPDAATSTRSLGGGTTATVVVSRTLGKAAFLATGMPTLPDSKTYELWYNDGGTMRPAGLMDPAVSDHAVVLDGRVNTASGMGVTVEPAGGSARPTSDPVALLTFAGARG